MCWIFSLESFFEIYFKHTYCIFKWDLGPNINFLCRAQPSSRGIYSGQVSETSSIKFWQFHFGIEYFLQNVLVGYFWHCCCCWAYSWICESDQKSWMNSSEKLPFKPNTNIFNQSESIWFLFYVLSFSFFKRVFLFFRESKGRSGGWTNPQCLLPQLLLYKGGEMWGYFE